VIRSVRAGHRAAGKIQRVKEISLPNESLESLSKETLIKLVEAYSRNWKSLDGLWFNSVESAYGVDAAVELDLQNWAVQAVLEARRLKEALMIEEGGPAAVLKVLTFMTWQLTSELFEYEVDTPDRAVIRYRTCAVQEGRRKAEKPVFPCKNMKTTLLSSIASVIDPAVRVACLSCPPDEPGAEYWCRWELSR
jgi:Family of unknown function (DUF6125)